MELFEERFRTGLPGCLQHPVMTLVLGGVPQNLVLGGWETSRVKGIWGLLTDLNAMFKVLKATNKVNKRLGMIDRN